MCDTLVIFASVTATFRWAISMLFVGLNRKWSQIIRWMNQVELSDPQARLLRGLWGEEDKLSLWRDIAHPHPLTGSLSRWISGHDEGRAGWCLSLRALIRDAPPDSVSENCFYRVCVLYRGLCYIWCNYTLCILTAFRAARHRLWFGILGASKMLAARKWTEQGSSWNMWMTK